MYKSRLVGTTGLDIWTLPSLGENVKLKDGVQIEMAKVRFFSIDHHNSLLVLVFSFP
jgi:hypothetical protein